MQKDSVSEATSRSGSQDIPRFSQNPKVYCRAHTSPSAIGLYYEPD
jgi:hypothetical protein